MIDDLLQEQAALYAMGCLPEEERVAFESRLKQNSELRELVASFSDAAMAIAGDCPAAKPSRELKGRILEALERDSKVIAFPGSPVHSASNVNWWLGAVAACLAIFFIMSARENALRTRIQDLNLVLATLQSTTNDLQQTVAQLRQANQVSDLRIAMLNSLLADQPKAVAVSVWDDKKQSGVFIVQNMKPLEKDKDYQLWVVDPQYKNPVDAGVFQVDEKGNARIEFKAKQNVTTAKAFAVTREIKGGVAVSAGPALLAGS